MTGTPKTYRIMLETGLCVALEVAAASADEARLKAEWLWRDEVGRLRDSGRFVELHNGIALTIAKETTP